MAILKDLTVNGPASFSQNISFPGGTVSGPLTIDAPLKWSGPTALPATSSLQYVLAIDPFASGGQTKYATISSLKNVLSLITKVGNVTSGEVSVSSASNMMVYDGLTTVGTVGGVDLKFRGLDSYQMPTNSFGGSGKAIQQNVINNGFYAFDKRATVTLTGFSTGHKSYLFDGSYESRVEINGTESGSTATILIDFGNTSTAPFTYSYGSTFMSFYYTQIPASVSLRVYGVKSGVTSWYGMGNGMYYYGSESSTQNVCLYWTNSNIYNISKWEFTVTSKPGLNCAVTQIEHKFSRGATVWMSAVTKYAIKQDLYGDVEAPKFIVRGGTSNQFLKADGSVDNSVYLESNQIAIASDAEIDDLFSDDSGSGI